MVAGEKLQVTLTTGMLGHVSQIKTQLIYIYIFLRFMPSSDVTLKSTLKYVTLDNGITFVMRL